MKKKIITSLFLFLLTITLSAKEYRYVISPKTWNESLGNHRALLEIKEASHAVSLSFDWRRHDMDVDKRCFLIINSQTGDTIKNIKRIRVNNETCKLIMGPIPNAGKYYFYYLPYKVQEGGGYYNKGYFPQEKDPSKDWVKNLSKEAELPKASIEQVESRSSFDSFYPMEVIATQDEIKQYKKSQPQSFYLFPENRKNPIKMTDYIPFKWINIKQGSDFCASAQPNEYYTFQIGVWTNKEPLSNLSYEMSDLKCGNKIISRKAVTCFNIEGIDPYGKSFTKVVNVKKGKIQPLWFGIDIAPQQAKGIYEGIIKITDHTGTSRKIPLKLTVAGEVIEDRGDNEPWRHSRLRWLNSTLGIADTPTLPYSPIKTKKNQVQILGRTITFNKKNPLPQQIISWGNKLLDNPISFVVKTKNINKRLIGHLQKEENTVGHATRYWVGENSELKIECRGQIEFDGWMNYEYTLIPKEDIEVEDIRLEFALKNKIASYFQGIGLEAQNIPNHYEGKWTDGEGKNSVSPSGKKYVWPFDSFWVGNSYAGIHCELRGNNYNGPLLNLYRPAYPTSWYNNGKGGFTIDKQKKTTNITVYSGKRILEKSKEIKFKFAMIITPVKKLNTVSQFNNRYYHNVSKPVPTQEDVNSGVKIINIHHANEYNPFINYPFLTPTKTRNFIKKWHKKDCKVKLYYTLRELSSAATELWAIRSLNHEILRGGKGGGFPWCREHLVNDYTPQWYAHFDKPMSIGIVADAALLTSESDSRWYNYYVEGLAWMVKHLDIDGIYMDDVSFDRRILKRMRRAMEAIKPGCIIDLHSNTGFSKGPANQYTDFFPYIDKLWFGESFQYNKMTPTNWLVESSGIPFGLMGDMLHSGGNKWLGMQYGMTVRLPWLTEGVTCNPRIIWKVWDDFGISHSKMIGFWETNSPVQTSDPYVKATTYIKKDKVLISIGNYSDEIREVTLHFDWKQLGLKRKGIHCSINDIEEFQKKQNYKINQSISIEPRKGIIMILENK